MATPREKVFIIDGKEIITVLKACDYLNTNKTKLQKLCKNNEKEFIFNGIKIYHFLRKPLPKPKDIRLEKSCTKCQKVLPNTREFFRYNSTKEKMNHGIVLDAKCIKCAEKIKSERMKKKRKDLREKGTTLYAQMPIEKKLYHIERNKKYAKNNKEKVAEKARKIRAKKTQGYLNSLKKGKELNKKMSNEMTDYYVARLLTRNKKEISTKELMKHKDLLDLHRTNLKLKRLCNQLQM